MGKKTTYIVYHSKFSLIQNVYVFTVYTFSHMHNKFLDEFHSKKIFGFFIKIYFFCTEDPRCPNLAITPLHASWWVGKKLKVKNLQGLEKKSCLLL